MRIKNIKIKSQLTLKNSITKASTLKLERDHNKERKGTFYIKQNIIVRVTLVTG